MRPWILTLLAAFLIAPNVHAAQGIHLRWDNCFGGGGFKNKTFACNTNSGTDAMYVSFVNAAPVHAALGIELSLDIRSTSATIPNWWQVKSALSCRQLALTVTTSPAPMPTGCVDLLSPIATLGVVNPVAVAADYSRIPIVVAWTEQDSLLLPANQEIFCVRIAFSHVRTVGTASCSGCTTPMCLGIHKMRLTRPAGYGDLLIYEELIPGSSTVSWQGATDGSIVDPETQGNDPGPDRTVTCSLPVPARNHTWGSLKSLYH